MSAIVAPYLRVIKMLIIFVYFFPKFAIRVYVHIHPVLFDRIIDSIGKWNNYAPKHYPEFKQRRVCLVCFDLDKCYLTACSIQTNTNDNLDSAIDMPSKTIIQNSTQVVSHTEEHSDPNAINQAVDEICVVLCDDEEEKKEKEKEKLKQMREDEILRGLIRAKEEKERQLRKMQQQQEEIDR